MVCRMSVDRDTRAVTEQPPRVQTPRRRLQFGLVLLGVGVLLVFAAWAFAARAGTPWAYLAFLLAVPNLVRGPWEIMASRRMRTSSESPADSTPDV